MNTTHLLIRRLLSLKYDDGDQTTNKILWTQEANEECEKVMNSKSFILSSTGKNMREIELEPIQTLYVLTKDA